MDSQKIDDSERDLALEAQLQSEETRRQVYQQSNLEMEDVMMDPKRYGVPTFAEFCKNPDKWRKAEDLLFASISNGGDLVRSFIKDMEFEFMGYKTKSLEEIERIAKNEGYNIADLTMKPHFMDVGNLEAGKLLVKLEVKKPKLLIDNI